MNDHTVSNSLPKEEDQEPVLSEQEKQFMAQYQRLWSPIYEKLHALVDAHVDQELSSEAKLLQLRAITESSLQQAIQGRKMVEIELMHEVEKIVNRPGLTWERVQDLTGAKS